MSKQPTTTNNQFIPMGGSFSNPFGQFPGPQLGGSQQNPPSQSGSVPPFTSLPQTSIPPQPGLFNPYVPQMAPQLGRVPFMGASITLVSKAGIRYEGILNSIDTENSSVALKDVKVFGSEGRREGDQIPAQEKIYDMIKFNSSDIQDLTVNQAPFQMGYPMGGYIPNYGQPHGFIPQQPFISPNLQGGFFQSPYQKTVSSDKPTIEKKEPSKVNLTISSQPTTTTIQSTTQSAPQTNKSSQPISLDKAPETQVEQEKPKQEKQPENAWNNNTKKENGNKNLSNLDQDFDFAATTKKWDSEQKKDSIFNELPSVYNKSSFFDNIEPEAKIRYDAREAYKTDVETFGSSAINLHRNQRRGSSFRGGRGTHKRRGGYRGNDRRGGKGGSDKTPRE